MKYLWLLSLIFICSSLGMLATELLRGQTKVKCAVPSWFVSDCELYPKEQTERIASGEERSNKLFREAAQDIVRSAKVKSGPDGSYYVAVWSTYRLLETASCALLLILGLALMVLFFVLRLRQLDKPLFPKEEPDDSDYWSVS
jgi:hypothetical protein